MVAISVQQHCDGHSNIFGATSDQHILSHCLNTYTKTFFMGKFSTRYEWVTVLLRWDKSMQAAKLCDKHKTTEHTGVWREDAPQCLWQLLHLLPADTKAIKVNDNRRTGMCLSDLLPPFADKVYVKCMDVFQLCCQLTNTVYETFYVDSFIYIFSQFFMFYAWIICVMTVLFLTFPNQLVDLI